MHGIDALIYKNRKWASQMKRVNPRFFQNSAIKQKPKYFWIGCSDSRVPVNQIIETLPGQIFVHRNVANVVPPSDLNCLSSLQYAVEALNVEHIIVCGHYGCGGVQAALSGQGEGYVGDWLKNLDEIKVNYKEVIEAHPSSQQWDVLCELNTLAQVVNVAKTEIVQSAWQGGQTLAVHGWLYQLHTGLLQDLGVHVFASEHLDKNELARKVSRNPNLKIGRYFRNNLPQT